MTTPSPVPVALVLAACAAGDAAQSEPGDAAATLPPAVVSGTSGPEAGAAVARRIVVAPPGNAARYRVREQLFGKDLLNDAVGATGGVTGTIAVDSVGALVAGESRITVDVTGLRAITPGATGTCNAASSSSSSGTNQARLPSGPAKYPSAETRLNITIRRMIVLVPDVPASHAVVPPGDAARPPGHAS
jgi:hypothetical protein